MRGDPVRSQPKPLPPSVLQRKKKQARGAKDKAESAKAKQRAGGRCEVKEIYPACDHEHRCLADDAHTHHLLSGNGRRARGVSALAAWKLRVCHRCHRAITEHRLVPVDQRADASRIVFRRVR